jgi:DNA polymerase-3 subunit epsilon
MRQIVLDTETTGLEPAEGHRIIEIGCYELIDRRASGRVFHQYLYPDREIDEGALAVHGITLERLQNSPRFGDIVAEFIDFVRDAELIIHNAPFDVGFINAELQRLGPPWQALESYCQVLDTLILARELHPGQRNNLDALCKRYNVDNSGREYHGALLDAQILAEVYLAMTGGQVNLLLDERPAETGAAAIAARRRRQRPALKVQMPSDTELAAHRTRLEAIEKAGGRCLWKELEPDG